MSMNSPAAPAAPVATASAAPAAGATANDAAATGNFLLMLGQLLGAPVPASTKSATTAAAASDESDLAEAARDAAALTGIPLPFATQMPQTAAGSKLTGEGSAAVAPLIGKSAEGLALADLSAELVNTNGGEESAPTNLTAAHLQPLDGAQQLRSAAVADSATSRPVHHSVGTSAWAEEVGTRMIMMTERGQHSASLRLSPEHLGTLEVRIAVRDDQASVWFGAAHADTRAAIEQALPRLRELFASQGLSLADAGVHHQAPREQGRSSPPLNHSTLDPLDEGGSGASAVAIKLGLVDAYA